MTAFILSATIAFALFELLAFTQLPPQGSFIEFAQDRLGLQGPAARALHRVVQFLIVLVILLGVLTVHEIATPIGTFARYEVNIIVGFIFGPLFAIWVNSVVVHQADEDLTRGQMFAAAGLALLFVLGVLGGDGSNLMKQYAKSLSSVKLGVAELSFAQKQQGNRDRLPSTTLTGVAGTYVAGGSNGLQNLAKLDVFIRRDRDYLTEIFTRKRGEPPSNIPVEDLVSSEDFAHSTVALPLQCLSAWFEKSADSGPVDKYLASYSDSFRRLEGLNNRRVGTPSSAIDTKELDSDLNEISLNFVHNGLRMALDIALSTTSPDVFKACKPWFDIYCPSSTDDGTSVRQCLRKTLDQCTNKTLDQCTKSNGAVMTDEARQRLAYLSKSLWKMMTPQPGNPRGLETQPYFAIGRASLMTQAGQHEAAAAVLDDWLRERRRINGTDEQQQQYAAYPLLQVKDEWFALRIRAMLATYVEEWLGDEDALAATIVRTEHLRNLQATIDGLEGRLSKADFFQALTKQCPITCPLTFKRPAECETEEPSARTKLWGSLYTSYVTTEYTYVHRALEHPDYAKFAEAVNDMAHRLANFDMSCGSKVPEREVVYGQSLLGFAENAVAYATLHAKVDDQPTQQKRLDEAERAVRLGLQIIDDPARIDQERSQQPYLKRIETSFAVSVQELLKQQLAKIEKARTDPSE
jgi:hypothetical protein